MELVRATDDTFCIAVLGDFLGEGKAPSGGGEVDWVPRRATPDSIMDLVGFRPRIRVSLGQGAGTIDLTFNTLEDFDPGSLFQRLPFLGELREARENARNGRPDSYRSPVDSPTIGDPQEDRAQPSPEPLPGPGEGGGLDLLDAILDVSDPSAEAPEPGSPGEIEAFVRQVVRPYLVKDDSDFKARVAALDEAASQILSEVMHAPAFQDVEAIWRSVVFLLSRIESTGKARVYLVQASKDDVAKDLSTPSGPRNSRLHSLLSNPQLGSEGRRWGAVVGAYPFGGEREDLELLIQLASIAQEADVPWISTLNPDSGGTSAREAGFPESWTEDPENVWAALRNGPSAAWLGLTYPRFLLREPFGTGARRAKGFDFKEETGSESRLLWALGAFVPVALMARGVVAEGRGVNMGRYLDLEGMPQALLERSSGGPPSSLEASLRPSEARALMEAGLIPLVEFPDSARVRVGGFHSVAGPDRPLAAWWRG